MSKNILDALRIPEVQFIYFYVKQKILMCEQITKKNFCSVYRKKNLFMASNNIKKRFEDISVFLRCWREYIFAVFKHFSRRHAFKNTL